MKYLTQSRQIFLAAKTHEFNDYRRKRGWRWIVRQEWRHLQIHYTPSLFRHFNRNTRKDRP
ncbi:MAG: hypothetical protein QM523_00540 [Candidatus Pacebacteria bacterium]|nr:hypothetical protein [Candidatus Paceibacterota bacterium]